MRKAATASSTTSWSWAAGCPTGRALNLIDGHHDRTPERPFNFHGVNGKFASIINHIDDGVINNEVIEQMLIDGGSQQLEALKTVAERLYGIEADEDYNRWIACWDCERGINRQSNEEI